MFNFNSEQGLDRVEMLKWISERNRHVPATELAFMLGIPLPDEEESDYEFDWE